MIKVHKYRTEYLREKDYNETVYEYQHQALCGYVRDNVTESDELVTCFYCLRLMDNETKKPQP